MQTAMLRRFGFILLVLAALAGAAAAVAANSRDPKKRINAADQAWARSIRIERDDLGAGDWRVEPAAKTGQLDGCEQPNLSDLVLTGEAKNPSFSRNGSFVSSEAEVWASEREAGKSWSRSVSWPIKRCLIASLRQGTGGDSRVTLTILSSGPLRVAKLAPRTLAYGVSFRIKGPAGAVSGRLAIYAFGRGRAEGSLVLMSLGKPAQPIPAALERRLARLVAQHLQR